MKELKELYDVFLATSQGETAIKQLIADIEANGYKRNTAQPLIWYCDKFLRAISINLRDNTVVYLSLIKQLKELYKHNKKLYPHYTDKQHEQLLCESITRRPKYKDLEALGII